MAQDYVGRAMALSPHRHDWTAELLDPITDRALGLAADDREAEARLARCVDRLFPEASRPEWLMATLRGCLYIILASRAFQSGSYEQVPRWVLSAARLWPRLLMNRGTLAILARSMFARVRAI